MAMLAQVNSDLVELGEEPIVAEELTHIEIADESSEDSEFDEWLEDRAGEVDSVEEEASVEADTPEVEAVEADAVEVEAPVESSDHEEVAEKAEAPRSSGEGRLRVVGSKSIDPSDVSDTMAKLRSAWNSSDPSKR